MIRCLGASPREAALRRRQRLMEASEAGPSDAADLSDVDSAASIGLASSSAESDEDHEFRGLEAGDANENSGADDASSASGNTSGNISGEDDSDEVAEEEPLLCLSGRSSSCFILFTGRRDTLRI